jgi:regulator of cell morphogenesis and NO signaling
VSHIDTTASLGALVAERPSRAQLFERLQLDYCCGGAETLAHACGRRSLDPDTVVELIRAFDRKPPTAHALEERDWRAASIAELCDHIVATHHEPLRRELRRISGLLVTVTRVHGGGRPQLHELRRLFDGVRAELEHHLESEERTLFPACRALEAGGATDASLAAELVARHEGEHAETGGALALLRELADGYDTERALCNTHRVLLGALRSFELDLRQHIHKENNVLFARVRGADVRVGGTRATTNAKRAGAGQARPAALPLCCQAWAAEQARYWARTASAG